MAKTVLSIHWQVDARLIVLPVEKTVNLQTSFGRLESTISPVCDYPDTYQQMLCLRLDEKTCNSVVEKISSETDMGALHVYEMRLYFGFCGFLTLEVYTQWDSDHINETSGCWHTVKKDIKQIVEWFSWNTNLLETWLHTAKDYLSFNPLYSFGVHRRLHDTMVRHHLVDEDGVNDSYVYTYQTVTVNSSELESLCVFGGEEMRKVGTLEDATCWQNFGNHLWLMPGELDSEMLHRLATATIIAAYTVLTYDVAVMNYKNMLRLLTERITFDTDNIRDSINLRNLVLQELGLATRDLNSEKTHLTALCLEEYGANERRQLFFDSQQSLRLAADGVDSGQQSTSSHAIEVIISVLTIMSVYSLVTDSYSLLTADNPHTPFSIVSIVLFALTTVFCLVTFVILFSRRRKK